MHVLLDHLECDSIILVCLNWAAQANDPRPYTPRGRHCGKNGIQSLYIM